MTNFDKALDEAAHRHEHELDVIGWDADVIYGAKNGFELGAKWSRDFTIAEVLRWMKEDYFKYPDNQITQAFEERFINQKEQK